MKSFRTYFISGLLFWFPLTLTVFIVNTLINFSDQLIPSAYRPEILFGFHIPGFGFIVAFIVIMLTGLLVANFIGRRLLIIWERLLNKIPIINSIYSTIKKLSDSLFTASSENFKKVLLIEYPRKGLWTIAFQTANFRTKMETHIGEQAVHIYVPTTPNPTSGFFIMLPKSQIIELDMSVEKAFKLIISMGIVNPESPKTVKNNQ